MKKQLFIFFLALQFISRSSAGQPVAAGTTDLFRSQWKAWWISCPDITGREYGVYHFRKVFDLKSIPEHFIIHVSADNRYKLFVNGRLVSLGPARGDLDHWRYETVDIASFLNKGSNVLAAVVWNFSTLAPWAQHSYLTGLIIQGNSDREAFINTGDSWKVTKNEAYSPVTGFNAELQTFIVVGPGDKVDGTKYPWGWQQADFDDSYWKSAILLEPGLPYGVGSGTGHALYPRNIPIMELTAEKSPSIRTSIGFSQQPVEWPVKIPSRTKAMILLDQTYLTNTYPELTVSGGENATITLTYAEALFNDAGQKQNRNDVENLHMRGMKDVFIADGHDHRTFSTLWFRTYRYLQVTVETKDDPLTIDGFASAFTGYPFEEKAAFESGDPVHREIWKTGWRTARLCAMETYFDCPYYEQLQYVGDTRIQALISLYVSGDDRLMRNAISLFDHSRIPEGLTRSRYPSSIPQVIPTYSLFYINMLHDYWMHRDDSVFINSLLPGVRNIIEWYEGRIDPVTGLEGYNPYWNFVDWPDKWPWDNELQTGGVPPGGNTGNSSVLTLQFAYTLTDAADLYEAFGRIPEAAHCRDLADKLVSAVKMHCWDEERALFADTPEKNSFSQHANILALLTGAIPENEQAAFIQRVHNDPQLVQSTLYFRFYLNQAFKKAGLGDVYTAMLGPWKAMLDLGLTTFAERPEPTRSDCHAWSASPNYDLLATVCGIEPGSPGFRTVKIAPHPGNLKWIKGSVPHPLGMISVELNKTEKGISGKIQLPEGLTGTFYYQGKTVTLTGGLQHVDAGSDLVTP